MGNFTGFVQFFFDSIPGFSQVVYNEIHIMFAKWDFWILLFAAFLPLPYGIFSISAGVFDVNIVVLFLVTLIGQGIRFVFLALVTTKFSPAVKKLSELNWKPVAIIAVACTVIAIIVANIILNPV